MNFPLSYDHCDSDILMPVLIFVMSGSVGALILPLVYWEVCILDNFNEILKRIFLANMINPEKVIRKSFLQLLKSSEFNGEKPDGTLFIFPEFVILETETRSFHASYEVSEIGEITWDRIIDLEMALAPAIRILEEKTRENIAIATAAN